ncbi:unnamed protein product [Mytilus coruscus]|uniref:CCHC-type domain-containing protein n=1 Tax=Mytilus coruscus TaxID=42192 RepID=A0A6J8EEJ2_MYTCO|nr:unnamed protein product [Mytilus coruscus]
MTVPTGGDILGYRDKQGFSQGSYGMTNDYGDNYWGDNTVTRGNNSRNKSYSNNKKPAAFDGTNDSVRIGLEFEAFANGHRRKFNNRAGLRMQTGMIDVDEQDDCQQMSSIMDRIAKIESNRGPNQSHKTDFLCYFCGKAGRFKRDCRKFLDMHKNGKYLPNNRFETSKWSQGTQTENCKSEKLLVTKESGPPLADVFLNDGPHKKCELNNDINDSLYF